MKTTAILFKKDGKWTLATGRGDTIPTSEHATAGEAQAYAAERGWGVIRAFNCDDTRMSRAEAVRQTVARVTDLERGGGAYVYRWYDPKVKAWRESAPMGYWAVKARRSERMIEIACELMGVPAPQYNGGNWKTYLP